MAIDDTPWFIGGGAEHSPEAARLLAYAAASGAEGVSEPASLKVVAATVPNGSVVVRPGAALIRNRYDMNGQQTYVLRNATSTSVPITPTGSTGGRTDAIVARILDPQYEGTAPTDPTDFDYSRFQVISGVSSSVKSAKDLNLSYPAILLAKVTIPASTGTITNSMITDLREVANPRTQEITRPKASTVSTVETLTATRDRGEWFPNAGGLQSIDIPSWATRMQIRAEWIMVEEKAGNAYGKCWVEYGPGVGGLNGTQDRQYMTQDFGWNAANSNDFKASIWMCVDDVYIPQALRGTTQSFVMKAKMSENFAASMRPQLTPLSGTSLTVKFFEVADPSTT